MAWLIPQEICMGEATIVRLAPLAMGKLIKFCYVKKIEFQVFVLL